MTTKIIEENKIIAICRRIYGEQLENLAKALNEGGVKLIEVTFDQADPAHLEKTGEAIRMITEATSGEVLPGAGTVMTLEQLRAAAAAGAKYIISPNTDEEIIKETKRLGLVSIPGAMTPSEISNAHKWGADFVKLFPTGELGLSYVKAIRAPISHVKLVATGGINEENLRAYLDAGMSGAGISGRLGEELPAICMDACIAAKKKGVTVFCDLNFRKKLWSEEKAQTVMCALMPYVDVVLGNEEDSEKVLGIKPVRSDVVSGELSREDYKSVAEEICGRFGCRRVAFSLRKSISANDNVWSGMLYENGNAEFSRSYNMHIVDRMGGGDSFGAGIIYATLEGMNTADSIEFATASSCLKHSIELDFNLSTLEDVHQLLSGDGSGRIQR